MATISPKAEVALNALHEAMLKLANTKGIETLSLTRPMHKLLVENVTPVLQFSKYTVMCNRTNNTQADSDSGVLNVDINACREHINTTMFIPNDPITFTQP
jgi:hypothetical protein